MRAIKDCQELSGKRVLVRVDFNVEVENGIPRETFKLRAAKETVKFLLEKECQVALVSHLGRPEGKVNPDFSLLQIQDEVESQLDVKIKFIDDCVGEKVANGLENLGTGEVLLLENVRFYPEEEKNDESFSEKLAQNFEIFVNDAFSVSHRDQASVTGVTNFLESYAGFWLMKEIEQMERVKNDFDRPAVAIIGGAKIETKLPIIQFFEHNYDFVLVGGKIANEAIDEAIKFSEKVVLPIDFVGNREDVGVETIKRFQEIISKAETIVWNGPTGKYEETDFLKSSQLVLEAILANEKAFSLVGGGETLEVLEKFNAMDKIGFVSTGGGAMLSYLGGEKMPGIEALK